MESAPTIPRLSARLLFISMSISAVTIVSTIRLRLKLREYITPPNVFLYTKHMKPPTISAISSVTMT